MQLQKTQTKNMRVTPITTMATFNTTKKQHMPLILITASFLPKKTTHTEGNVSKVCLLRNKDKLVNVNAGTQPNTCWKPLLALLPELDLDYHLRKISDQHQQKSQQFLVYLHFKKECICKQFCSCFLISFQFVLKKIRN